MIIQAQTHGEIAGYIVGGAFEVIVPVTIVFNNSGTAVNDSQQITITNANLLTDALINTSIKSQVSSYVNTTYSLSTTTLDILLWGPAD